MRTRILRTVRDKASVLQPFCALFALPSFAVSGSQVSIYGAFLSKLSKYLPARFGQAKALCPSSSQAREVQASGICCCSSCLGSSAAAGVRVVGL
jgi:hypothetical protein